METKAKTPKKLITFLILLVLTIFGIGMHHGQYNYLPDLSTGNHGMDLYAAQALTQNEQPHKDFQWIYGPLTPHIHKACLTTFGIDIQSILIGQLLFKLLSGILIFLILSLFIAPWMSCLGTLWFWLFSQGFSHTFNHTGATPLILAAIYALFLYIRTPRIRYTLAALICAGLIAFVKISVGSVFYSAILIALILAIRIIGPAKHRKNKLFWSFSLLIPTFVIATYAILFNDVPTKTIRAWLTYTVNPAQPSLSLQEIIRSGWAGIQSMSSLTLTSIRNIFLILLALGSLIGHIVTISSEKTKSKQRHIILMTHSALFILTCALTTDYLLSGNPDLLEWCRGPWIIFLFFTIGLTIRQVSKFIKILLCGSLLFFLSVQYFQTKGIPAEHNTAQHRLTLDRADITIGNNPIWIETLTDTTRYLNTHMQEDEALFALPHDPIYYFLTGKLSPIRFLAFPALTELNKDQEHRVIYVLKNENVEWIVLTNSTGPYSAAQVTDSSFIGEYIDTHFKLHASFGTWETDNPQESPYGTLILKRQSR